MISTRLRRLLIILLLLVVVAGCGRIGFEVVDGDAGSRDAGAIDAAPSDASLRDARALDAGSHDSGTLDAAHAIDGGLEFPTEPFGSPRIVEGLATSANEDDPSLTADLLEIYFDSDRSGGTGGGDIWMSRRTSVTSPWTTPINVTVLNSDGDDATPDVSPDGLTLYYVTARGTAIGAKDVYVSTRASRDATWSAPVHVAEVSTGGDEAGPSIRADGLALYLGSNVAGGDDDLYFSVRASISASFGAPSPVTEINTGASEGEPWISWHGRFLAFASDRPDGAGGSDLYYARRATPGVPFEAPRGIDGVNTPANEGDPWLSSDGTVLFFARSGDIWTATR